jgi:hypothetical protein
MTDEETTGVDEPLGMPRGSVHLEMNDHLIG